MDARPRKVWPSREVDHGTRGLCPVCRQEIRLNVGNGTLRSHKRYGGSRCEGVGAEPETPIPSKQEANQQRQAKSADTDERASSAWTVASSGLPGLGKRR